MRTISEIVDYWVDGSVGSVRATEEGEVLRREIEENGKEYPVLYRYIDSKEACFNLYGHTDPLFDCMEGDVVEYDLISSTTMDIEEAIEPIGLGRYNTVQIEIHNAKGLDVNEYTTKHEFEIQKEVIIYGRFKVVSIEYDYGTFTYRFHGKPVVVGYDRYVLEQIR